ncbi:MAG: AraC family transcriptional regulator [Alphaproteobacteria bacterium PA4]|nr:MAG: AraC family transcriptional regulator [Alphaproteobacteria bacterium PA4]
MTRAIRFLVFADFQILDLAGPLAAFEIAGRFVPGAYALTVCAETPGPVPSSAALAVEAAPLDEGDCDTLVVVGGEGTRTAMRAPALLDHVRRTAAGARRTTSICSGSFVLAAAGLLDGRRATTHWRRAAELARQFRQVSVVPDRIFVRDGPVWTSAGITAGIDLALALIADDLGPALAAQVAKEMVVPWQRPGGQSQFSTLAELPVASDRIGAALAFARDHLAEPLPVERLAAAANLSPRQFARAFHSETGTTPARAVAQLRVEAARAAVAAGGVSIEQIAAATGFGDPERMRRAFIRVLGQPPQALRRTAATE